MVINKKLIKNVVWAYAITLLVIYAYMLLESGEIVFYFDLAVCMVTFIPTNTLYLCLLHRLRICDILNSKLCMTIESILFILLIIIVDIDSWVDYFLGSKLDYMIPFWFKLLHIFAILTVLLLLIRPFIPDDAVILRRMGFTRKGVTGGAPKETRDKRRFSLSSLKFSLAVVLAIFLFDGLCVWVHGHSSMTYYVKDLSLYVRLQKDLLKGKMYFSRDSICNKDYVEFYNNGFPSHTVYYIPHDSLFALEDRKNEVENVCSDHFKVIKIDTETYDSFNRRNVAYRFSIAESFDGFVVTGPDGRFIYDTFNRIHVYD